MKAPVGEARGDSVKPLISINVLGSRITLHVRQYQQPPAVFLCVESLFDLRHVKVQRITNMDAQSRSINRCGEEFAERWSVKRNPVTPQ